MSLDVYLNLEGAPVQAGVGSGIFVRRNGATVEVSREEWDRDNPGIEPVTYVGERESSEVYSRNITHNLGRMAGAADLYKALWRPDENGIDTAAQLIAPLTDGLMRLRDDPEKFKLLNPENGWGNYEGLVAFVADYLAACERFPAAKVSVWR